METFCKEETNKQRARFPPAALCQANRQNLPPPPRHATSQSPATACPPSRSSNATQLPTGDDYSSRWNSRKAQAIRRRRTYALDFSQAFLASLFCT
ncbi:unnamed protein product [Linum trigynum]|uniref:Uncharacterized protein n=1 Tax=Linum trigynum TaxID=586398 RepID=A0AAV2FAN2_9ROSI